MQSVFKNARRVFEAGLKKKVTPYEWGKEVAPGLLAVETVGHTPGHTSYVLSSGSGKVFIQSDVTNIPNLFAANPGWHAFFDQDAAMAEKTRRTGLRHGGGREAPGAGLPLPVPGARQCREGRQRLPGDPGAVESGDLTRVIPGCADETRNSISGRPRIPE